MKIVPLEKSNLELFVGYCYVARSDMHPHLLQGTVRKHNLYAGKLDDGLRGLIAQDLRGSTGIIEWMPIEISHLGFDLPGAIYLHCLWVKPDYEGKGIGSILMECMLSECGDVPVITFGYEGPDHMPKSFFERYGFEVIETYADILLMLRPASGKDVEWASSQGSFIRPKVKHERMKGRKPLFLFHNDFCPHNWLSLQRVLKDVKGRGDIYFRLYNCNFLNYPEACGEGPTLYLDGELKTWNPCSPGFVKGMLKAGSN